MTFEAFYLNEDPDLVYITIDHKQYELFFYDPSAYTFGFVNGFLKFEEYVFDLPSIDDKLFVQNETTHPVLMRDVLFDTKVGNIWVSGKQYNLNDPEAERMIMAMEPWLARGEFFNPAGRMWLKSEGSPCNLMSWWNFSSQISKKHIMMSSMLCMSHETRETMYTLSVKILEAGHL